MTFCNLIRTPKFLFLCTIDIFSVLLLWEIYAEFLLGGHSNIDIYTATDQTCLLNAIKIIL